MKTKIIKVGDCEYQLRKLTPSAGSFIYFKMMGSLFNAPDTGGATDNPEKAREVAAKMPPEDKARALVVSTFLRGLDYQYIEFAQRHAMQSISRVIHTGGVEAIIPIMHDDGRWIPPAPGEVDLEDEAHVVQQLTLESLVFSLAGFFAEASPKR